MTLQALYQQFLNHPESQWIMRPQNAELLYNYIKNHKIKKILELGCGIGAATSIMALAFKDKGETDYHIDSMEQFDKCIKIAEKMIPEEFKKNITIHKSDAIVWSSAEIPYYNFSIYETLPDGEYDLYLEDGPSPFMQEEHYIDLPNGVIHKLTLDGKIKSGTQIIYDGRLESLKLLERYFSANYLLTYFSPQGNFNVLERKDNELKLGNDRYEAIKKLNYFEDDKDNINNKK